MLLICGQQLSRQTHHLKGWHGGEEVRWDAFEVEVFDGQGEERGRLAYEGEDAQDHYVFELITT